MAVGGWDAITNGLKIAYPTKNIEPMVNEEAPFRAWLKKSIPAATRVREGTVKFGANFNPPQNVGQILDGGSLPVPKDRTQDQFELVATLFPATFQIGWITRRAANTSKGAFNGGELRRRTEETIADNAKFIEQTYLATTCHGWRCQVNASTTSAVAFVGKKPNGVQVLRENMQVTVRTSATGNSSTVDDSCDNIKITAITQSTNTVTFGAGYSLTADSFVTPVGEGGIDSLHSMNSNGAVGNGIRGLVDDTTWTTHLHKLSKTTYPKLKANVKGNSGTKRDLTESILINACHEIRQRSGKRPTDAIMNTGQAEQYIEFVAPDRRYPQTGKGITPMATGYQEGSLVHYAPGVALNLKVWVDVIPREIFLLNRECVYHYVAQDMGWWDEGAMLKPLPGTNTYKASFFAALASIENIGTDNALAHCVIRDLNDPLCGD